jgi:hypothetical protein
VPTAILAVADEDSAVEGTRYLYACPFAALGTLPPIKITGPPDIGHEKASPH